jgi:very-short-patch-repair endonuclease
VAAGARDRRDDGWEAHSTPDAFQADRAASNAYQLEGYVILRFTRADLRRRPRRVAQEIRAALGSNRAAMG